MHPSDLLDQLADLARAAGLEVRTVGRAGPGERDTASGVCRVNGVMWVMLSEADPLDERVDVLATALAQHAGDLLESRYLPPAIRARIAAARRDAPGGG